MNTFKMGEIRNTAEKKGRNLQKITKVKKLSILKYLPKVD